MKQLKFVFIFLTAILYSSLAQNSHMFPKETDRKLDKEIGKGPHGLKTGNIIPTGNYSDDYFQLPKSLSPISYFVRLLPFVNGDQTVRGYAEIIFEVLDATSVIIFNVLDLTLYEDTLKLETTDGSNAIEFISHSYNKNLDFYIGSLSEPLKVRKQYKLSMNYDGVIRSDHFGFYQSSYTDNKEEVVRLATTQMQPKFARTAFPCFDEPTFKATFQLELGRENFMTAISNMPVIMSRPIEELTGWTWDLFDVSPIMSSYLNAFVISDFVNISATSETGVVFNVWTHKEQIQHAEYSLDAGHRISTFFEDHFDIPYPLPKQDMIAIPDYYFGAMENWGLITYTENGLLLDPLLSSLSSKRGIVQLISHEVAHMWLGNLVTLEWWSDAWLNEGFAAYYQYLGTDEVEPDFDIMLYFCTDTLQEIFKEDSLETSKQIRRDVPGPSEFEILDMFGGITYSKGASLVRMMDYFLTPKTFLRAMRNYLKENAYGNVVQEILFEYLDTQAKLDGTLDRLMNVQDIMETWTLQPGYPLITVQINGDGTALLTQERYLQIQNPDAANYTYWVPITYTSEDDPNFSDTYPSDWMSPVDDEKLIIGLSTDSSWYIFNLQQSSFYRVNYDKENWKGIISQLLTDFSVIDIRNRAQLLDDSFNFAYSGRISFDIPLEIASYLGNENHYVPWEAGINHMVYIEKMFSRTLSYTALRNYLRSLTYPGYDRVGSIDDIYDSGRNIFLRSEIVPWACDLLYQPCLDYATQQYSEWMTYPNNYTIISPNLKSSVYCTAVSEGTENEWDFALDRYQSTESSVEVRYLLFAMACSKDTHTLLRYLDMPFNGDGVINEDDAFQVFSNVASTDLGRDIAWDYLVTNYIQLAAFFESFNTVQSMAAEVSKEFNTEKDLSELELFKHQLTLMYFGSTDIIDAAIQNVEDNISWMDNYYKDISDWLDMYETK